MGRFANQNDIAARVSWLACCLLTVAAFLAAGCDRTPKTEQPAGPLPIVVGIPPLQHLVEQIGGKHVKVDVLVQPGQDPHTFDPSPQQVMAMGRAAVFFKIGMPFEAVLLDKVQEGNQRLVAVDATHGIEKRPIDHSCADEPTGHNRNTHAVRLDPHVWLSPPLLTMMAANIAKGLCDADPAHDREYRQNLESLMRRLDALHKQIHEKLAPYRGRSFYVFHPGFAYFADAYGLTEEPIQVGGQEPTPKQLGALIAKAKAEGVKTVFVQPEFDPQSVQFIADALAGQVVTLNGLGENVVADIEDIAAKIETAMRASSPRDRKHKEKASGK
jgi:zinc transport system substrate-binding protein